jgi:hypothetical protein
MNNCTLLFVSLLATQVCCAQDAKPANPAPPVAATAPAAEEAMKENFEKFAAGKAPDELFVVEGEFTIVEEGGNKFLQGEPAPLEDNGVLLGKAIKDGGVIQAKIRSSSKKRSHPRFGIGLGGSSGFRLRYVGNERVVEITREDERKASADFTYKADAWMRLELSVRPSTKAGEWTVEGRIWEDGQPRPDKPVVFFTTADPPPTGKASVWSTPFSEKPIQFDDVEVTPGSAAAKPQP